MLRSVDWSFIDKVKWSDVGDAPMRRLNGRH